MEKIFVSNKDESVEMFRNSFLNYLSRVHYLVPIFLYLPILILCLYRTIFIFEKFLFIIPLFVLGIVCWTLTEYILHRFIFHFHPKSKLGQRIHFIVHGVHHQYPNDSKRLVMVPTISIPLCVFFYILFYFIVGSNMVDGFFVGYLFGYLFYDISHYALHHFNFRSKFWLNLKQHHMKHHYLEPENGFGVSSTFWDLVFKTTFKK